MTEVYINDILADLEEEETVAASYGGVTFGNMAKRKGVKTNTYTLPFTQQNKTIYQGAEVQGSFSEVPYRKGVIRVDIDGVTVFEGWCTLDESKEGYEVQSFAGASDFYSIINTKKLTELDLSEWSHVWNEVNIKSSWNRSEGYIYAFVEYGKEHSFNEIPPDYLLPQLFFHTAIKQIATDAGYTLYGDVLTNPRFLNHMILANKFPLSIQYGGTWDLATIFDSTMTQSKLWLDFANMYGLQFDINELTGEIYANYIDNILFNEPEDWTIKIDISEKPRIRYRFTEWGRNTILRYKFEPVGEGNAVWQSFSKDVSVDDDNLNEEAVLYESPFFLIQDADAELNPNGRAIARTFTTKPEKGFAGIWQSTFGYVESPGTAVWWNGTYYTPTANSTGQQPPNGTYWKAILEKDIWDIKSRPMYGILTIEPAQTLQVKFPTPVVINRVVNNHNMDWEYTYQQHWRVFDRIKDRTKRVESLVKLNYADVNQLDFNRAKRIDNELYYLEEVKQFKLNRKDSTLVELVRI